MDKSRGPAAPNEIFPDRLRAAREHRKLSQAELATRSGLQSSAVSHFETGSRRPSFDNLRRLADALHVSTDYLLGRADSMEGSASADVFFRDFEKLSASDRDFATEMIAKLAARNNKGEPGGGG